MKSRNMPDKGLPKGAKMLDDKKHFHIEGEKYGTTPKGNIAEKEA